MNNNKSKYVGILLVNKTIVVRKYSGLDFSSDSKVEEVISPFFAENKEDALKKAKKHFAFLIA